MPLIHMDDGKVLGEWAGLCKYNAEGKAVKVRCLVLTALHHTDLVFVLQVVGCSCVVIKSFGEESAARTYLINHLKSA